MNGIARVCAYYFSQYSVPLMLAAAVRHFSAGIIIALVSAVLTAICLVLASGVAVQWGVMAFFYTMTFSVFILFMAGMCFVFTGELPEKGSER